MKQLICIISGILTIGLNLTAQPLIKVQREGIKIETCTATVQKNYLVIDWSTATEEKTGYWEVQASKDGVEFSAIGMVMGADPVNNQRFIFKQALNKIKQGYKLYRVVHIGENDEAMAGKAISLSK